MLPDSVLATRTVLFDIWVRKISRIKKRKRARKRYCAIAVKKLQRTRQKNRCFSIWTALYRVIWVVLDAVFNLAIRTIVNISGSVVSWKTSEDGGANGCELKRQNVQTENVIKMIMISVTNTFFYHHQLPTEMCFYFRIVIPPKILKKNIIVYIKYLYCFVIILIWSVVLVTYIFLVVPPEFHPLILILNNELITETDLKIEIIGKKLCILSSIF